MREFLNKQRFGSYGLIEAFQLLAGLIILVVILIIAY
jgi:hypothetical protein